jgi:hypothetical protein
MKQCKQCSREFEPKSFRGTEQNYCSKECRTKAGNERYKQKLMNNGNSTNFGKDSSENIGTAEKQRENYYERQRNLFEQQQPIINSDILRYIEQCYEARTNAHVSQLKYEAALQELNIYKSKLAALEEEFEEEPEPQNGIIGMLNDLPEWLTPAIGKLLQSEKVQNFVINSIPEPEPKNN